MQINTVNMKFPMPQLQMIYTGNKDMNCLFQKLETLLPPSSFPVITILYLPSSKEENLPTRSTLLRNSTLTSFIPTMAFLESRLVEEM
jgi:hypothetical protein